MVNDEHKGNDEAPRWLCLLCKSDRPGHHRMLDDRKTPCPNGAAALAAPAATAPSADDERKALPDQQWKCGNEFLPFHPQASHVRPDYRDGWNDCYRAAEAVRAALGRQVGPESAMVWCGCGDGYGATSYEAGFIHGCGRCPNCDAATLAAPAAVAQQAIPDDVANLLCSVADNLGDMPISDEYAEKTSKAAVCLLEKYECLPETVKFHDGMCGAFYGRECDCCAAAPQEPSGDFEAVIRSYAEACVHQNADAMRRGYLALRSMCAAPAAAAPAEAPAPASDSLPKSVRVKPDRFEIRLRGGGRVTLWRPQDEEAQAPAQAEPMIDGWPLYSGLPPPAAPAAEQVAPSWWLLELLACVHSVVIRADAPGQTKFWTHVADLKRTYELFKPRIEELKTAIRTAPPTAIAGQAMKPLSDETIRRLWKENGGTPGFFARAIEAALGIGKETPHE